MLLSFRKQIERRIMLLVIRLPKETHKEAEEEERPTSTSTEGRTEENALDEYEVLTTPF